MFPNIITDIFLFFLKRDLGPPWLGKGQEWVRGSGVCNRYPSKPSTFSFLFWLLPLVPWGEVRSSDYGASPAAEGPPLVQAWHCLPGPLLPHSCERLPSIPNLVIVPDTPLKCPSTHLWGPIAHQLLFLLGWGNH